MPSLGADMEYGTVIEWLVGPGDVVRHGDIVAVVHTEKADIDVEVFENGTVGEILVPVGQEVEVGTPLATILGPKAASETGPIQAPAVEPTPPTGAVPAPTSLPHPTARTKAESQPTQEPARLSARPRITPRARRLAATRGVDLSQLAAADRVVTGDHVDHQAESRPATVTDQQTAMRHAIAVAMSRANREIPHYHLLHHTPLTHALAWLERRNAMTSVQERVLPAALFCRAVVVAVQRVPGVNGFWVDDAFRPSDSVHLGCAIALRDGGLIAPAILDADHLDLGALMRALRDLTGRVRSGRLRGREMTDATITVTNLGENAVEVVHGVIYPPQVALVGFGGIVERPWVDDGAFAARKVVAVSLAGDHRASDGRLGARFLGEIDRLLRNPEEL